MRTSPVEVTPIALHTKPRDDSWMYDTSDDSNSDDESIEHDESFEGFERARQAVEAVIEEAPDVPKATLKLIFSNIGRITKNMTNACLIFV